MQKRRVWKVAIGHFLLSLLVLWELFHGPTWVVSPEQEVWVNAGGLFLLKVFFLLQPLFSFFVWGFHLAGVPDGNFGGLVEFLEGLAMLFSVPLWSICFAWLFVKFDNWLNHFSVLGRKVF